MRVLTSFKSPFSVAGHTKSTEGCDWAWSLLSLCQPCPWTWRRARAAPWAPGLIAHPLPGCQSRAESQVGNRPFCVYHWSNQGCTGDKVTSWHGCWAQPVSAKEPYARAALKWPYWFRNIFHIKLLQRKPKILLFSKLASSIQSNIPSPVV